MVRAIRIGLTGPIGCGKSTVARLLTERGAAFVDADAVARAVTEPGRPGHDAVIETFGPAVRSPDGTLDRPALAMVVFNDPGRLRELESIVHPLVRPLIVEALARADDEGRPAVLVEAIKLVEGGLAELCDEVWLVTCEPGDQLRRLVARGSAQGDAEARIRAQGDIRARLAPTATRVIDTTGASDEVRARVVAALGEALAASPPGT